MNVTFSVGCHSRIRHCTKDRKNPIFCAVSDAAVTSATENHGSCKQTIRHRQKGAHSGHPFPTNEWPVTKLLKSKQWNDTSIKKLD
jgi:hypothetical protein